VIPFLPRGNFHLQAVSRSRKRAGGVRVEGAGRIVSLVEVKLDRAVGGRRGKQEADLICVRFAREIVENKKQPAIVVLQPLKFEVTAMQIEGDVAGHGQSGTVAQNAFDRNFAER